MGTLSSILKLIAMKSIYYSLIFALALSIATSCGSKQSDQQNSDSETQIGLPPMHVDGEDSLAIRNLVDKFMSLAIAGDYTGAFDMVYTNDPNDSNVEPTPLEGADFDAAVANLKTFPITSYEIKNIIFDSDANNEVRCSVVINNDFNTGWYFKPVRYCGEWYLCVKNSLDGDQSLQKDSSTRRDIE